MEYHLGGEGLTPKERNLLIRYLISVATRGICSTKALLRPFKQKYLQAAFDEKKAELSAFITSINEKIESYNPASLQLPAWLLERYNGAPTKEQYAKLYAAQIAERKRNLRELKHSYCVCVSYGYVGKALLAFHESLHRHVTFGYSNWLHEACDFAFDEARRAAFLTALSEEPAGDWGLVVFGQAQLIYEDLTLFRGNTCILETVSHEEMMTLRLEEDDLRNIAAIAGGARLPKKLETFRYDAV